MNNDIIFASKSRLLDTGATFNLKKLKKSPSLKSARKAPSLVDGSGMASLGLLSLIAACGGDGGGATGPADDLPVNKGGSVGADGSTTYEVTNTNSDALDDTVVATVTSYTLTSLSKINASTTTAALTSVTLAGTTYSYDKTNNKEFSLSEGATATKKLTVSSPSDIFMSHGDISGKGVGDIAVISPTANSNAGSIDIIWDYPSHIDPAKTFNVAGDKADIKHLTILGDADDRLTDVNNYFRFYSETLEDDKQILIVGTSGGENAPRDIYVVWDLASYADANASDTIDLSDFTSEDTGKKTAISQKALLIQDGIQQNDHTRLMEHGLIRLAKIDNNDKQDLIVVNSKKAFAGVKVIWDFADYAPGGSKENTGVFDFTKTNIESLFAGTETIDGVFAILNLTVSLPNTIGFGYKDTIDIIDVDNDGLNDLFIRTGSYALDFVLWGSQIFDKAGQGRSDIFNPFEEYDGTESSSGALGVFGTIGVFDHKVGDYEKAGLYFSGGHWYRSPNHYSRDFSYVRDNFWLADVDGDGIRDAVSRTPDGDNYNFWSLSTKLNILPDAGTGYVFHDESTGGEKAPAGTKKAAELLKYGLLITKTDKDNYFKKDVNGDGLYELVKKTAIAPGEDHAGSHKVWFKGLKFEGDQLVPITNDEDKIFKVKVKVEGEVGGEVEGEADAYLNVAAAGSGGLAANVFYTDAIDLA